MAKSWYMAENCRRNSQKYNSLQIGFCPLGEH